MYRINKKKQRIRTIVTTKTKLLTNRTVHNSPVKTISRIIVNGPIIEFGNGLRA